MRASAFADWNTTFVCIVPPSVGSGCANTTAARGWPDRRVDQRLERPDRSWNLADALSQCASCSRSVASRALGERDDERCELVGSA